MNGFLKRFAAGHTQWQTENRAQRALRRYDDLSRVTQWHANHIGEPILVNSYSMLSEQNFTPSGRVQLLNYRGDIERKFSHAPLLPGLDPYIQVFVRHDGTVFCAYVCHKDDRTNALALLKPYWFLEGRERQADFMEDYPGVIGR